MVNFKWLVLEARLSRDRQRSGRARAVPALPVPGSGGPTLVTVLPPFASADPGCTPDALGANAAPVRRARLPGNSGDYVPAIASEIGPCSLGGMPAARRTPASDVAAKDGTTPCRSST